MTNKKLFFFVVVLVLGAANVLFLLSLGHAAMEQRERNNPRVIILS